MKKVLSFVACAAFVAAMAVSCGHKNQEATEDTTACCAAAVEEAATEVAPVESAVAEDNDADHAAMLDAAREAGRAKCNCYKTDAASVESCIKSIIAQSYAAYQDNDEFKAVMEEEFNSCVKEKATAAAKEAAEQGIKAGASALADKLNKK